MAQSGGCFLHMAMGQPDGPSIGTKVTRGGGVLIGAALITLAVGLIQTAQRSSRATERIPSMERVGLEPTT
jgi:hypothetical protein